MDFQTSSSRLPQHAVPSCAPLTRLFVFACKAIVGIIILSYKILESQLAVFTEKNRNAEQPAALAKTNTNGSWRSCAHCGIEMKFSYRDDTSAFDTSHCCPTCEREKKGIPEPAPANDYSACPPFYSGWQQRRIQEEIAHSRNDKNEKPTDALVAAIATAEPHRPTRLPHACVPRARVRHDVPCDRCDTPMKIFEFPNGVMALYCPKCKADNAPPASKKAKTKHIWHARINAARAAEIAAAQAERASGATLN